ncbi:capsule assembly Wzi family protein [Mucilaginibacter sp. CAU 1740]|uniref:capsule assembly Wzi family protein n=1 Tax=Mucilaginibacter sp. CAU 1740 TaxID=3140365 RepID=UPI00325AC53B
MKKIYLPLLLLLSCAFVKAQTNNLHINLETQAGITTDGTVPFWLRANKFGSVPVSGGSGILIGRIRKDYDTTKTFGWSASFEGRGNVGSNSNFTLIEGFVKAHAGLLELKAGRSKDIIGLVDSSLSSGSFAISGNALGIPKVSIGVPNYYSLPVFGKLLAIKAVFATGYAGTVSTKYGKQPDGIKSFYLENYLYAKIGKPSWRFSFETGFNHEVLWGDERRVLGPSFTLSGLETYWYAIRGKVFNQSKVGNHLGSLDVAAEYRFDALTLRLYRQNFYDKGALASLANISDGLNGITIANNQPVSGNFSWRKLLFEFLYTANQAGYLKSKRTESGAEDYYNNYEYTEGWSYKLFSMGTPFITQTYDGRADLGRNKQQFFINNRLWALHGAAQFYLFNWYYTGKVSFSHNLGTFATGPDPYKTSFGAIAKSSGTFKPVNQLSLYLASNRSLRNGYAVGYELGCDRGALLYNSFGVILKVSKTFL